MMGALLSLTALVFLSLAPPRIWDNNAFLSTASFFLSLGGPDGGGPPIGGGGGAGGGGGGSGAIGPDLTTESNQIIKLKLKQ